MVMEWLGNLWGLFITNADMDRFVTENHLSRELTNGTWFILNVYILYYLMRLVLLKANGPIWRQPDYIKLAWGVTIILTGSALRSGWVWLLLLAEENHWSNVTRIMQRTGFMTYLAIGFAIWGSLCVAKMFQSSRRTPLRQCVQVLLLILSAILIPVIVHIAAGQANRMYLTVNWWWYTGSW